MTIFPEERGQARRRFDTVGVAVWAFAIAGGALRLWISFVVYPRTGDPIYSYSYRAMLVADGNSSAIFLQWQPPGYPMLLGALTWLGAWRLSPYAWGVAVSVVTSVALVVIVDRLAVRCVRWAGTRLVIASL